MGFRLGLRQRSRADRPDLMVTRYRSQEEYERDVPRKLADGWRMSGWQRLDPDSAPDVIIASWVRQEGY
jgi:hypothetical protein